ncbi:MAG: hypothetical protein DRR06_19385, partial [Gammaproteobacteria bacterium]
ANTVDGILANLGKTTDDVTGEVLAPGTVVGADGATFWVDGGPNVPLAPGATVPGTTIGPIPGILANLGKTVDNATGLVVPVGDPVGTLGGTQHGHGASGEATTTDVDPGEDAEPSELDRLGANKINAEGVSAGAAPVPLNDLPAPDPTQHSGYSAKILNGPVPAKRVSVQADGGTVRVTPLGEPDALEVGGFGGATLGKCGTTMGAASHLGGDGTPEDAGQADMIAPGGAIGPGRAHYYPPTQATGQADYAVLPVGGEAPSSTTDMYFSSMEMMGLSPSDLGDPGGVVFDG